MGYLVFARKFRPQTFEEVVGQEPIITTLQNAIRQNRVPQNFLFAGPRGCGKTSTARILAKALNCIKGPTDSPCGKCLPCQEVTASNSLDVLEIDGASNRGIDEIRNLRETVKFKPTSGRVKIYIIDEVHMLTAEAFNALLKTLEEPPPHVKFVFATTEPHKVPLTILSRCHRFNFKRIPVQEIAKKLEEIAKAEKIKYDKNALFLMAKTSDGALRDAEGMLDQLASFSEGKITEGEVLLMLGLASEEIYFSILSALKGKDARKIFSILTDLYESGGDLVQFAKGLLEMFRHLLLLQCAEETKPFIEISEEGIRQLVQRKNDFPREQLLLALSFMGNLQGQLRRNLAPPRLLVEVALLKLLHLDGYQSVNQLAEAEAPKVPGPFSGPVQKRDPVPSAPSATKKADPSTVFSGKPCGDDAESRGGSRPPAGLPVRQAGEAGTTPTVGPHNDNLGLNDVETAWPRVVDYVKTKRMSTGIFLSEAGPVEIADNVITLGFPTEFQFHKDMLEKSANKQLVEEAFEVTSGKKIRVQFVVTRADREEQKVPGSFSGLDQKRNLAPSAEQKTKMTEIITEALNIFDGAKIIRTE